MLDKIMDFGVYIAESYPIWIIGSLLLFAGIYAFCGSIYSFHLENLNSPNRFSKTPVVLTDPKQVKQDKILCYLAASFWLIVGCGLCMKIILYTLGLIMVVLSGILQVIVFVALFVVVVFVLIGLMAFI